jgi:ABC-type nitrate/sulfonate/bicarbonate transport system substrate-binding protein
LPRSRRRAPPASSAFRSRRLRRLETTTVRIAKGPSVCVAPTYLAEELLRAEGFTDIHYVQVNPGPPSARALARGEIDFTTNFSSAFIVAVDAGEPITMLAGEHVGCYELFAREGIRGIPDPFTTPFLEQVRLAGGLPGFASSRSRWPGP